MGVYFDLYVIGWFNYYNSIICYVYINVYDIIYDIGVYLI